MVDMATILREQIYSAVRAFTCATVAEAEAATKGHYQASRQCMTIPRPSPFEPLTDREAHWAAVLWAEGKNTAEIATHLQVHEARVFNSMAGWMPRARKLREWRAKLVERVGKSLSTVGGTA